LGERTTRLDVANLRMGLSIKILTEDTNCPRSVGTGIVTRVDAHDHRAQRTVDDQRGTALSMDGLAHGVTSPSFANNVFSTSKTLET
jgi:hypothetical protein